MNAGVVELAQTDAGRLRRGRGAEAALLAAAIAGYEAEAAQARTWFYAAASRGRPEAPRDTVCSLELRHRGHVYAFRLARLARDLYRVEVDGCALEVRTGLSGRTRRTLCCGGKSWRVSLALQGSEQLVEVDGVLHRIQRDQGEIVRAPAPAVVVSLAVQEGDVVAAGAPLAVLEAMKVETTLLAPAAGRVRRVLVRRNAQVGVGTPLLVLEPAPPARRERPASALRVSFESLEPAPEAAPEEEARRLMQGYDVEPRTVQRRLASGNGACAGSGDPLLEEEVLRTFVDVASLFRRQSAGDLGESGRHSVEEYLFTYLRDLDARGAGLPASFLDKLRQALAHYGVESLDRSPELEESLFRIAISQKRLALQAAPVLVLLERCLERPARPGLRELLERLIATTHGREPAVHDLAREVRYRLFDRPFLLAAQEQVYTTAEADLARLAAGPGPEERAALVRSLVDCTQPLHRIVSQRYEAAPAGLREALLEVMVRRYYRIRELGSVSFLTLGGQTFAVADYLYQGSPVHLLATHAKRDRLVESLTNLATVSELARRAAPGAEVVADLYLWSSGPELQEDATAAEISTLLAGGIDLPPELRRVAVTICSREATASFTFRRSLPAGTAGGAFEEEKVYRDIHPMMALRLELWRLSSFRLERLPSPEEIFFFRGVAQDNPRDERLFAIAEVRDLTPLYDGSGRIVQLPQFERTLMEAFALIRRIQARRAPGERLQWNRVQLHVWPPVDLAPKELHDLVHRLSPLAEGLGLEKLAVRCRVPEGELRDQVLEISNPSESGMLVRFRKPKEEPLKTLREYAQKVVELRRRGLPYPYEVIKILTPPSRDAQADLPAGDFVEHDLDASGRLVPVDRPYGQNTANMVVGVLRNFTARYPEGMARVILLGDPSRGMGALAEPECRRIIAALDLAAEMGVPLEWFAHSAGARIAMDSGTENMDWIAKVLRRLVELTQKGLEVNIVVVGINVGAQPYWNAEATMLMHTRGIVIMTPEGAMVLTGKQALDYSGGVSAEDNQGIGGYERIMGPNGQAQYFARDLGEACRILLRYYEHSYVAPGERFPRPAVTSDPKDRDVCSFPHGGELATVGEVFSDETNPGRKRPFEIRRVMAAVADQDHEPLERWYGMHDAEIAVVWDAHLGGHPVCLLGFESKPLPRLGWVPAYGPDQWTGGTLFPLASKKVARAINAASKSRPLVVLANLSGFDGSPESMRQWQLEYGAEIGRAIVNFEGPIVFCVVSRYHGGAFVVFSAALNDNLEVAALEGTHASVIGGAPAAAVVFAREVDKRTKKDRRIAELEQALADPERSDKAALQARLAEMLETVRSEKLGEVAEEFDHIHSVERARQVGSVHHIIAPERLRPYLIDAIERGMARVLAGMS